MWKIKENSHKKYVNLKLDVVINEFPSKRCNITLPKNNLMIHEIIWCMDRREAFTIIKKKFGQKVHKNLQDVVTKYKVEKSLPF